MTTTTVGGSLYSRGTQTLGVGVPRDDTIEIDDLIVLLLGAPSRVPQTHGRLQGITRLEKLVFLLERETSAQHWLAEKGDFTPYNFGPFSAKVYTAVDMLSAANIVQDSGALTSTPDDTWEQQTLISDLSPNRADPYVTRDFALTERGWKYYAVLTDVLPDGALDELSAFKDRFARLPLRQLVRYVYERYESYTERSLIKDEILGSNG